jgi:hypothetical protein
MLCTGRFHDLLEKQDGKWLLVLRQPTYEKDILTPVNSSSAVTLDQEKLAEFPIEYRNLAYMQELAGYKVKRGMPGLKGSITDALYAYCRAWLKCGPARWEES